MTRVFSHLLMMISRSTMGNGKFRPPGAHSKLQLTPPLDYTSPVPSNSREFFLGHLYLFKNYSTWQNISECWFSEVWISCPQNKLRHQRQSKCDICISKRVIRANTHFQHAYRPLWVLGRRKTIKAFSPIYGRRHCELANTIIGVQPCIN